MRHWSGEGVGLWFRSGSIGYWGIREWEDWGVGSGSIGYWGPWVKWVDWKWEWELFYREEMEVKKQGGRRARKRKKKRGRKVKEKEEVEKPEARGTRGEKGRE